MNKFFAIGLLSALLHFSAASAAPPSGYVLLDDHTAPAAASSASVTFETVRGASLRETLQHWAQTAGWQEVVWRLPPDADFTLGASARFQGDFLNATRALVNALGAEANLRVRFHHANRVVVVERMQ